MTDDRDGAVRAIEVAEAAVRRLRGWRKLVAGFWVKLAKQQLAAGDRRAARIAARRSR